MVTRLEEAFPGLSEHGYAATSPPDSHYNCIAWAAGDARNWWWPSQDARKEFWPIGIVRERTLDVFVAAFATLGYEVCGDEGLEPGFEKIALFTDAKDRPTHAARQLVNGRWSSKLGKAEDIEHDLHALEGTTYGKVARIMKRMQKLAS